MNMEKMSKLEKDHKALELRLAGNTYEDISTELGYATRSASYKAVARVLRGVEDTSIAELKELELRRLDVMQFSIWNAVESGDEDAIALALRISDRRSKMLGLDAPHRIEAKASIDVMSWNQAIKDFLGIYRDVFGTATDDGTETLLKKIDEIGVLRASEMSYNGH